MLTSSGPWSAPQSASLVHVRKLTRLVELQLTHTLVDDAGIGLLAACLPPQLALLRITRPEMWPASQVTSSGTT